MKLQGVALVSWWRRRRPVEIVFSDRYSAMGIEPNGCDGPCEGTGFVPVRLVRLDGRAERDDRLVALWHAAERSVPSDDGYHFVPCPDCDPAGAASVLRGGSPA